MFFPIRHCVLAQVTALALAFGTTACFDDRCVRGTAESTSQVSAALSVGAILWVDGTYGGGCIARSGSWSLRVSGSATMDYPALSVIKNNGACTLTLTSIVADKTYAAAPTIALATSYNAGASTFTSSATLTPTKDAHVQDGTGASSNFGTGTVITVKQNMVNFDRNVWMTFDTSAYAGISSAALTLYLVSVGAESPSTNVPVSVYYAPTASDSWSETTLTWNTVPSPGNTPSGSIASQTILLTAVAGQTFTWNVSSSVASDNDGKSTLVFSAWAGGNSNHALNFGSRESAHPPTLQINYGTTAVNAMISTATFSADFVVTLLVSDIPRLGTGALTAH